MLRKLASSVSSFNFHSPFLFSSFFSFLPSLGQITIILLKIIDFDASSLEYFFFFLFYDWSVRSCTNAPMTYAIRSVLSFSLPFCLFFLFLTYVRHNLCTCCSLLLIHDSLYSYDRRLLYPRHLYANKYLYIRTIRVCSTYIRIYRNSRIDIVTYLRSELVQDTSILLTKFIDLLLGNSRLYQISFAK